MNQKNENTMSVLYAGLDTSRARRATYITLNYLFKIQYNHFEGGHFCLKLLICAGLEFPESGPGCLYVYVNIARS